MAPLLIKELIVESYKCPIRFDALLKCRRHLRCEKQDIVKVNLFSFIILERLR